MFAKTVRWIQALTVCFVAVFCLTACVSPGASKLSSARKAYDEGDYSKSYRESQAAMRAGGGVSDEAAYLAGLSAYQLQDLVVAERNLQIASRSQNPSIANDATALLGMTYAQREEYESALRCYLESSTRMKGQERANAFYYAGVTQQKLGRWEGARVNLNQALRESRDADFKKLVSAALKTTGYTLQFGAFLDPSKASKSAQELAKSVADEGLPSPRIVRATDAKGREMSLVQVGSFSSYSAASAMRRHFDEYSPLIVPLTAGK
jgi:tetratricopeptide (TPR) repeat protein